MTERRTPLYDVHLRTASKLVKGGGDYLYPVSYSSPLQEHLNTRSNVGMQDLSTMGEVDIKGPGAERLINRLVVNEIRDMHPGQVRYTTMCNEDGGILDDVTVYKFGDEHFMVVTSSGPRKNTARWINEHSTGMSAYVTDLSGAIGFISVQGPRSLELLEDVSENVDLDRLRFFWFTDGMINGSEVLISRSGYTGELGYELYIPAEETAGIWEYFIGLENNYGLMPYGVSAMQSLRIEKAFPLYGPDINATRNPFEVGLSRWINFDKRDFIGREALLQLQDIGLQERWVGLELSGKTSAKSGDRIFSVADINTYREKMETGTEAGDPYDIEKAGVLVGEVTSSAVGHSVNKVLALGYLQVSHGWPGNQVLIEINDRPVLAKVVDTPFFDPGNMRMRSKRSRRSDDDYI
jgi:aminomethyltransferase